MKEYCKSLIKWAAPGICIAGVGFAVLAYQRMDATIRKMYSVRWVSSMNRSLHTALFKHRLGGSTSNPDSSSSTAVGNRPSASSASTISAVGITSNLKSAGASLLNLKIVVDNGLPVKLKPGIKSTGTRFG